MVMAKSKFSVKDVPEEIWKEVDIEEIKLWASLDARSIIHKWIQNQLHDGRDIDLNFVSALYQRWNNRIQNAQAILYALNEI